jgi:hypothetical protein
MLEIFGYNGLARIEQQDAAESVKRLEAAKVIDADYTEVSSNG